MIASAARSGRKKVLTLIALAAAAGTIGIAHAVLTGDGSEFQVNTHEEDAQYEPALAALSGGEFVVVWTSYYQDGDRTGVFGQIVDSADGELVGDEFQINTYTTGRQRRPDVAAASDGSFLVVWDQSPSTSRSLTDVYARLYDSDGGPAGAPLLINTTTTNFQGYPSVASIGEGDFVIVWHSEISDSNTDVFVQRFDRSGTKIGDEVRVNTYTTGFQENADVESAGDGSFVVVWSGRSRDTGSDVFGQRFGTNGSPVGEEFSVNTYTTQAQARPRIAVRDTGSFVVVWASRFQDGSYDGVFGQRFNASASPLGTEFQANAFTSMSQGNESGGIDVAYGANGDFVIVWGSWYQDDDYFAVVAQHYESSGEPSGTELIANQHLEDSQRRPAVAPDGDGFVIVWDSYLQDDYYHAVMARRFTTGTMVPGSSTTTSSSTTNSSTTSSSTTSSSTTSSSTTTSSTMPPVFDRMCGDVNADDKITAGDALGVLRAADGSLACDPCVCDVDQSGDTTASDALRVLRTSTGETGLLDCADCLP